MKIRLPNPMAWLRRFRGDEAGNTTIEFVILFPLFMVLFLSAIESGIYMTRYVMLERGLDDTVRAIRLGTTNQVDVDDVKQMICSGAAVIPDCQNVVKVEMIRVDPLNHVQLAARADCVDRNDPAAPARNFATGESNDFMLLRVCALFNPLFPTTGLGFQMPREDGDSYALVSMSAFVMEPG